MQLQKKYLVVFFLALKGTDGVLSLKEARTRDLFLKPLFEATQTFEQDRNKIYEKYGTLREGSTDTYEFSKENAEVVQKELTELLEEEVSLTETPGLKGILERTEYKPKAGEAELIDAILAKL